MLTVAMVSLLGVELTRCIRLTKQLETLDLQATSLRTARASRDKAAAEQAQSAAVVPPYFDDAKETAATSAFPLDRVLVSLEAAQLEGMKVSSLEIVAKEGLVRVEVDFPEYRRLIDYVDALNAGEGRRWEIRSTLAATAPGRSSLARLESRWASE